MSACHAAACRSSLRARSAHCVWRAAQTAFWLVNHARSGAAWYPALATAVVRRACGFGAPETDLADLVARQSPSPILRDQEFGRLRPVDLSVESELFSAGNWMDGEAFPQLGSDAEVAVGRFDEVRLGEPDLTDQAPATLHLGADLFVPVDTVVFAPLDATVVRVDGHAVVSQSRVDTTMFFDRADRPRGRRGSADPPSRIPGLAPSLRCSLR
ncbi:hypothetical protein P9869_39400 [Streptomyces ossamyceticus]|nr:hypothetical protein [Streptomyces ossamyceticus]